MADGERAPDLLELQALRSLQDDLSRAFARLMDVMNPELTILMSSGTLQLIALTMLAIGMFQTGDLETIDLVVMYVLCALVVLVVPCEVAQAVLSAVGETRDQLLRPRWHRPELFQELSLFRDTVHRDLDTLGDLGLFRLQRSTILAIAATVLTYVIILVQFFVTELAG